MAKTMGSSSHRGETDVIVLGDMIGYSVKAKNQTTVSNDYYQQFKVEEAKERCAEEARILYVAMTRAKRRFIYFDDGKPSGTLSEPKNWQILLRGDGFIC